MISVIRVRARVIRVRRFRTGRIRRLGLGVGQRVGTIVIARRDTVMGIRRRGRSRRRRDIRRLGMTLGLCRGHRRRIRLRLRRGTIRRRSMSKRGHRPARLSRRHTSIRLPWRVCRICRIFPPSTTRPMCAPRHTRRRGGAIRSLSRRRLRFARQSRCRTKGSLPLRCARRRARGARKGSLRATCARAIRRRIMRRRSVGVAGNHRLRSSASLPNRHQ